MPTGSSPIKKSVHECKPSAPIPAATPLIKFARFIRDDQAKWAKLMGEAGIKPE
jgi:hypothetical protein